MARIVVFALLISTEIFGQDFQDAFAQIFKDRLEQSLRTFRLAPERVQQVRIYAVPDKFDPTMFFLIGTEDPSALISLRLPDDTVVTKANASSKEIQWEGASGSGFDFYACRDRDVRDWTAITLPPGFAPGEYIIDVRSSKAGLLCVSHWTPILGREGVDYEVVGDSLHTDREFYQLGDDVTISVPIKDDTGSPVNNASVEAVVSFEKLEGILIPGDEVTRLQLSDPKGDGTYQAVFRAPKASRYNAIVTIAGRKRREQGHFEVRRYHLSLLDASIVNKNGYAQAAMRFEVVTPGRYRLNATVQDANGKATSDGLLEDLTIGQHTVRWNITHEWADVLQLKGPFALTEIHVVRLDPEAEFGGEVAGWWMNQASGWKPK